MNGRHKTHVEVATPGRRCDVSAGAGHGLHSKAVLESLLSRA